MTTSTWTVARHVSFNRIEGDIVLLDARQGKYFGLDETASLIWEVVAETGSRDRAVEAILKHYEIDAATARRDVDETIELWTGQRLLERVD